MKLDLSDSRIPMLLEAWGAPYSYGAGEPKDAITSRWPRGATGINHGVGWDCSGLAQVVLVKLGRLLPTAIDRTAQNLFNLCRPITFEEANLGDLCFYGRDVRHISHVTVYLGNGVIFGANGGGATTNGDDPKAYVKLDRYNYRADFRGFRRLGHV